VSLHGISEFVVPFDLIDATLEPLQEAGADGFECFVLWGGRASGSRFRFESFCVPEQTTARTRDGLLVTVEGEALFKVNRSFYNAGLVLGAQVHSHPGDAYHSDTDDAFPMMTLVGGLSGVVPDFGSGGRSRLSEWAWYRLAGPGRWAELDHHSGIVFR
jgi:hypothetical protein